MISHPFMTPTQPRDPPRNPPIMQDETYVEPDMHEFSVAATTMEEAPAHAVVTYIFVLFLISFNLIMQYGYTLFVVVNVIGGLPNNCRKVGVVTQPKDSDQRHRNIHVMQDYLRIARGVTIDHNVYVWS